MLTLHIHKKLLDIVKGIEGKYRLGYVAFRKHRWNVT